MCRLIYPSLHLLLSRLLGNAHVFSSKRPALFRAFPLGCFAFPPRFDDRADAFDGDGGRFSPPRSRSFFSLLTVSRCHKDVPQNGSVLTAITPVTSPCPGTIFFSSSSTYVPSSKESPFSSADPLTGRCDPTGSSTPLPPSRFSSFADLIVLLCSPFGSLRAPHRQPERPWEDFSSFCFFRRFQMRLFEAMIIR